MRIVLIGLLLVPLMTTGQTTLRYDYRQFLKTWKTDWMASGIHPLLDWSVNWQSVVNETTTRQLRDEVSASFLGSYPLIDSVSAIVRMEGLSLWQRQDGPVSTSHDWKPAAGLQWIGEGHSTAGGAGIWMVSQSNQSLSGPSLWLNHESRLVAADRLAIDLSGSHYSSTADRRGLKKQQVSLALSDPVMQAFDIRYTRSVNERDFVTTLVTSGYQLDHREETTDQLTAGFTLPLFFSDLTLAFSGSWKNRQIDRKTDLAGPQNPNYQVLAGETFTDWNLSWQPGPWQVGLMAQLGEGSDSYGLLETQGLAGLNESIQSEKLKKRNISNRFIRLVQSTTWSSGDWSWKSGLLISRDQLFNPNNNSLDDRDAGTIGISQGAVWKGTQHRLSGGIDYQQTHQVFIHRDRSGDNYRNHYVRLMWEADNQLSEDVANSVKSLLSSQLRFFDYDANFLVPKSFVLRTLTVEDSLRISILNEVFILRALWTETQQGTLNTETFRQWPTRRLWGRMAEAGWLMVPAVYVGYRLYIQDQDRWQSETWQLVQSIRQQGVLFRLFSAGARLDLSADGWLMQQSDGETRARWYPTLTFRAGYRF